MAEALSAIMENPKLLDADPKSLVLSVARIAGWGLTIGEKAYLIPYKGKVKAVRDYKGDAELVINAGGAKFIDAFNFYSNERFEHEQGGTPFIKHTPLPPAKRGALIGSYAVAIIGANLPPKLKVMYNEEIDEIRKKHSHEWKEGTLEQIPRHFYGPKTCVKQICKLLPTNPRLQKVMAQLDEEEIADADFEITGGGAVDEANASQAGTAAQPTDRPEPESAGDRDLKF
jgi:phage RecT family recombinase